MGIIKRFASEDYFKSEMSVIEREAGGVTHSIVQNTEEWIVSWTKDNIECAFAIDCSEDVLYEIIESIYGWRINE